MVREERQQRRTQLAQRARHVRLNRLQTDAELRGDLRLTQAVTATEDEDFPAATRQRLDGRIDRAMQFGFSKCEVGIVRVMAVKTNALRHHELRCRACHNGIVTDDIERAIPDCVKQPRLHVAACIERRPETPELQESILHELFSVRTNARHALREAHKWCVPCAEDDGKRVLIAGAESSGTGL